MTSFPDLTEPPPAPYDLGQNPADIVVISALPTDIAALSEARATMSAPTSLRLVHLDHLSHPGSVDQHLDSCALLSRLVILRLPDGGESWPYGLAQYSARCGEAGVPLAALPGAPDPAPELRRLSTVSDDDCDALCACLDAGGPDNARLFLQHCQAILQQSARPEAAVPPPATGLYWPGDGPSDNAIIAQYWQPDQPVVAFLFPRALLHGAGLHPVNRMIRGLMRAGLNPLPVFTADARPVDDLLAPVSPAVILSCLPGSEAPALPSGTPVLHAALSSGSEADWIESADGLRPCDIAEHILLPMRAGQIVTRAIATLDEVYFDDATECPILAPRALGDRVEFTARLAANWAKLCRIPRTDRKIAFVLDGPEEEFTSPALHHLQQLQCAGYAVDKIPEAAATPEGIYLPMETYQAAFAALPWPLRDAMERRWGAPGDDPDVTPEAGFHLPGWLCGALVLARAAPCPADAPPSHRLFALYVWLRQVFGAQAVVHLGGDGGLGALPGKALALSAECWPEQVLGALPHIALLRGETGDIARRARTRLHALCLPADSMELASALDGTVVPPDAPALPSADSWREGRAAAEAWIGACLEELGDWPQSAEITFRAAPTARFDGQNVARALSLMGFQPGSSPDALTHTANSAHPRLSVTPHFAPCFRRYFPELQRLIESAFARH